MPRPMAPRPITRVLFQGVGAPGWGAKGGGRESRCRNHPSRKMRGGPKGRGPPKKGGRARRHGKGSPAPERKDRTDQRWAREKTKVAETGDAGNAVCRGDAAHPRRARKQDRHDVREAQPDQGEAHQRRRGMADHENREHCDRGQRAAGAQQGRRTQARANPVAREAARGHCHRERRVGQCRQGLWRVQAFTQVEHAPVVHGTLGDQSQGRHRAEQHDDAMGPHETVAGVIGRVRPVGQHRGNDANGQDRRADGHPQGVRGRRDACDCQQTRQRRATEPAQAEKAMAARHDRSPIGGLDLHGVGIDADIEQAARQTEHEQSRHARPVAGQPQHRTDGDGGQEARNRTDGSGAESTDERAGPKHRHESRPRRPPASPAPLQPRSGRAAA